MARKETMAERKYCKNEKDIHPDIAQSCLMDTSRLQILSGSQQNALTKLVEFEGETDAIDPCGNFIRLHTHSYRRQKFTQADL